MQEHNRRILLKHYPTGVPDENIFSIEPISMAELKEEEVLVRTLYLSVDPYMRSLMTGVEGNYPQFKINETIVSSGVGQVVISKNPLLSSGDFVEGAFPWQDYFVTSKVVEKNPHIGRGAKEGIRKLDSRIKQLSTALSVFGMSGLTAYFGITEIGNPQCGETVVISAAAGAVGSVAGQLAKIRGARVIGLAGSPNKIQYLKDELGFDMALNYKSASFASELHAAVPNGIDIYFENVGGTVSETVFDHLKVQGRVILCGMISTYHDTAQSGKLNLWPILLKSVRLEGLMYYLYEDKFPTAVTEMAEWMEQGKLKASETVVEGLEMAPNTFSGLFRGNNVGKTIIKVA